MRSISEYFFSPNKRIITQKQEKVIHKSFKITLTISTIAQILYSAVIVNFKTLNVHSLEILSGFQWLQILLSVHVLIVVLLTNLDKFGLLYYVMYLVNFFYNKALWYEILSIYTTE